MSESLGITRRATGAADARVSAQPQARRRQRLPDAPPADEGEALRRHRGVMNASPAGQACGLGWRPRALSTPALRLPALLLCAVLLAGCSTLKLAVVNGVADQLAAQGAATEDDLGLAREASAFYLKLSESLLAESPGHLGLATAVASGFTQYAYAFVAFEAEKLEGQDARAAKQGRERAARLYARAQRHAFAALGRRHPQLLAQLAQGAPLPALDAQERLLAYWGAAAWGAGIALSTQDPERVADLPAVARLAAHLAAAEPGLGDGDLQALLARLEAARPGGNAAKAQALFEAARRYGGGANAGLFVAEAEAIALPAGDRAAYETLLRQALAAAAARRTLANELMRERASWLLATLDERF